MLSARLQQMRDTVFNREGHLTGATAIQTWRAEYPEGQAPPLSPLIKGEGITLRKVRNWEKAAAAAGFALPAWKIPASALASLEKTPNRAQESDAPVTPGTRPQEPAQAPDKNGPPTSADAAPDASKPHDPTREELLTLLKQVASADPTPGKHFFYMDIAAASPTPLNGRKAYKLLDKMADDPESGVHREPIAWTVEKRRRTGLGYRFIPPNLVLHWNGISEEELAASPEFQINGKDTLESFVLGSPEGASEERDVVSVNALAGEIIGLYQFLTQNPSGVTLDALFQELQAARPHTALSDTARLERALRWMQHQWFPIFHSEGLWRATDPHRRYIASEADVTLERRGDSSPAAVVARVKLAMEKQGLNWIEVEAKIPGGRGAAVHSEIRELGKFSSLEGRDMDHSGNLFRALGELGVVLGREPSWLFIGLDPEEWETDVYDRLPEMTFGGRLRALRYLSWQGCAEMIDRGGIPILGTPSLRRLEDAPSDILDRLEDYPVLTQIMSGLVRGLRVRNGDPFYLLTGYARDTVWTRLDWPIRIKYSRLAAGETMRDVGAAEGIGLSAPSVSLWESGGSMAARYRRPLAAHFGRNDRDFFAPVEIPEAAFGSDANGGLSWIVLPERRRAFAAAVHYLNRIAIPSGRLSAGHVVEMLRLLHNQPDKPKLSMGRARRLARHWAAPQLAGQAEALRNFEGGLLQLANWVGQAREECLEIGDVLYKTIVIRQSLSGIDWLPKAKGDAQGHHRIALLVVNFMFVKNGLMPFDFLSLEEFLTVRTDINQLRSSSFQLIRLFEDRVGVLPPDARSAGRRRTQASV